MCRINDLPDCIRDDCLYMPDGVYALCQDCRKYVICTSERIEIKSCPNTQYWGFDTTTKTCQYKSPDCYDCSGMLQTVRFCGN